MLEGHTGGSSEQEARSHRWRPRATTLSEGLKGPARVNCSLLSFSRPAWVNVKTPYLGGNGLGLLGWVEGLGARPLAQPPAAPGGRQRASIKNSEIHANFDTLYQKLIYKN